MVLTRWVDREDMEAAYARADSRLLAFFTVLTGSLVFLRDVTNASVPSILFTLLIAIAVSVMRTGASFAFFCFLLPLMRGLPSREIALAYLVFYTMRNFRAVRFSRGMLIVTLGMVSIELIDMIIYGNVLSSSFSGLYNLMTLALFLFIPVFWFSAPFTQQDILRAVRMYCYGALLGGLIAFAITTSSIGFGSILSGGVRLGTTSSFFTEEMAQRINYNPNQLSIFVCIAIAFVMVLRKRRAIGILRAGALFVAFVLLGLMTMSRAFLLGFALILLFMIFLVNRIPVYQRLGTLVLVVAAAALVAMLLPESFYLSLGMRVTGVNMDDISNGRVDILAEHLVAWAQTLRSFFLGYGNQTYATVLGTLSAHNLVNDIFISWGLFGLVLMGMWFGMFIKKQMELSPGTRGNTRFLPFLVLLLVLQTSQFITSYNYVLLMTLAMLCIRLGEPAEAVAAKRWSRATTARGAMEKAVTAS